WMPAGDQSSVGVEGDAPTERCRSLVDQLLTVAFGAEAEQLVVLELLVGEGVVAEREIDVVRTERGCFVGGAGRVPRHRRRTDDGTDEHVAGRIGLALQRRRDRA